MTWQAPLEPGVGCQRVHQPHSPPPWICRPSVPSLPAQAWQHHPPLDWGYSRWLGLKASWTFWCHCFWVHPCPCLSCHHLCPYLCPYRCLSFPCWTPQVSHLCPCLCSSSCPPFPASSGPSAQAAPSEEPGKQRSWTTIRPNWPNS